MLIAAVLVPVFVAVLLMLVLTGPAGEAAREQERSRRLAEARMEARLLRFNI